MVSMSICVPIGIPQQLLNARDSRTLIATASRTGRAVASCGRTASAKGWTDLVERRSPCARAARRARRRCAHRNELLAAPATDCVDPAQDVAQRIGELAQRVVAGRVTEPVVECLEVIEAKASPR
jgi:hypothetical protein